MTEQEQPGAGALPEDAQRYEGRAFARLVAPGIELSRVEFSGCVFNGCALGGASLYRCTFDDCRFVDGDLSNVAVVNARFTHVRFERCKLVGIDWTQAGDSSVSRLGLSLAFEECLLDYGNFFGLDLRQVTFVRCSARGVDLSEARLTGVDCRGTDFAEAKFLHTDLSRADLREARRYRISPTANTIKKARFSLPEALTLLDDFDVVIE